MIAVSGASGFVGKKLCNFFMEVGQEFLPIVHKKLDLSWDNELCLDLSDSNCLDALMELDIDYFVHLAAIVPRHSFHFHERFMNKNRDIDNNVLKFCANNNVPVIYMSSCGVYNKKTHNIKFENDVSSIDLTNLYYTIKYESEKLFMDNTFATILRLSSPIGPGQNLDIVASRFINMVICAKLPIQLRGSGMKEQDFIDVNDVAKLIYTITKSPKIGIFNAVSGKPTTMLNLAESVIKAIGYGDIEFTKIKDLQEGYTARYSNEKVRNSYNWSTIHSLEDSIKRIVYAV